MLLAGSSAQIRLGKSQEVSEKPTGFFCSGEVLKNLGFLCGSSVYSNNMQKHVFFTGKICSIW